MLKAIIFDLDETLLDWSGRIPTWPEHEYERLRGVYHYIHNTVHPLQDEQVFFEAMIAHVTALWQDSKTSLVAPHFGHALVETLFNQGVPRHLLDLEACIQAYRYGLVPGVKAYPEVPSVLADLKGRGLLLGLATNALHPMILRDIELAELNLLHFFEQPYRLSAADVGYLKPHPRIFEEVLGRMEVEPSEAVFVGDSLRADVVGAQGVGLKAIWRRQSESAVYKNPPSTSTVIPDATIHDLNELATALDHLFPGWQD
jgi:putative hydrolase of the HAD superfamily